MFISYTVELYLINYTFHMALTLEGLTWAVLAYYFGVLAMNLVEHIEEIHDNI
jgi:hypothetical protein